MAIFSDGLTSTIEHLAAYDTNIFDLAAAENISVPQKLALAEQQIGLQLQRFLRPRSNEDQQFTLDHVVVSDAILHWHRVLTLLLIYRDAVQRNGTPRYNPGLQRWIADERAARELAFDLGIGVVYNPLPRPPAPQYVLIPGGATSAGAYFLAITWTRSGVESAPSVSVEVSLDSGQLLRVLPPPTPADITSWSVYAGYNPYELQRQNLAPLTPGESWTQDTAGFRPGPAAPNGQKPDLVLTRRRRQVRL
jgi:hypothetical protein